MYAPYLWALVAVMSGVASAMEPNALLRRQENAEGSSTTTAAATTTTSTETVANVPEPTRAGSNMHAVCRFGMETWNCELGEACGEYPFSCVNGDSATDGDGNCRDGEGAAWSCPDNFACTDRLRVCVMKDRFEQVASSFKSSVTATATPGSTQTSDAPSAASTTATQSASNGAQRVLGSSTAALVFFIVVLSWF